MFMACGTVWAQAKGRGKSCRWVVTSRLLCSKENLQVAGSWAKAGSG